MTTAGTFWDTSLPVGKHSKQTYYTLPHIALTETQDSYILHMGIGVAQAGLMYAAHRDGALHLALRQMKTMLCTQTCEVPTQLAALQRGKPAQQAYSTSRSTRATLLFAVQQGETVGHCALAPNVEKSIVTHYQPILQLHAAPDGRSSW